MKVLALVVVLLLPLTSMAESSGRSTLAGFKESRSHRLLPLNHVFLNMFPLPLLTDSFGVGLEAIIIPKLTVFGTMERQDDGYNEGILDWMYSTDAEIRRDSSSIGARYYLRGAGSSSWYAGAGYKWGSVKSSVYSGNGQFEDKTQDFQGAYGSAGYRFLLGDTHRLTWLADLNLGYGPGEARITGDRYDLKKVEVGYSAALEGRIGLNF